MTDAVAKEISDKLDLLVSLSAISVTDGRPQKQQIELLGKAGLPAKDIADLIGTTRNTVSVTLSKMKKCKGKTKPTKVKLSCLGR